MNLQESLEWMSNLFNQHRGPGFLPLLNVFINPSAIEHWTSRNRTPILSDREREAAYARARVVLRAEMEKLVANHGWDLQANNDQDWCHISKTSRSDGNARGTTLVLRIPLMFSSFLSGHRYDLDILGSAFRPVVERLSSDKIELFINDDPTPLANIFYFLQTIAPGMFSIMFTYEYDPFGELEWSRAIPRPSWIEEHRDMLIDILGSLRYYQIVLSASKAPATRYEFYANHDGGLEEIWPHTMAGFPRLPDSLLIGSPSTS